MFESRDWSHVKPLCSGQEQILSESLKTLVCEKGEVAGEEMRLKGLKGGNSLAVTVGKSSEKPAAKPISSGFMASLQKKLNCSEKKLLMLAKELKTKGVKFEEHIREDLVKLSHSLDEFYTVEKLEFIEKRKKPKEEKGKKKNEEVEESKGTVETKVELDLVYLKDPPAFIEHVIEQRGLDRAKVLVRVGLDGGQGSFKVVASIFETDYDPEVTFGSKEGPGNRLTGANRLLVMAMAEDMQELYFNLRIVMDKLKLNDIDCCFASDLKLINCLLGISSHSGKHACPYCEGEMTLEAGVLRTFGRLQKWHRKFEEKGSKMADMRKFANVIHPSLIKGDEGTTILSTIPLPELHLLMGVVNWSLELLYQVVPQKELQQTMRTKGISVHGYHGGGLDGGNSNLFLKHLVFIFSSLPDKLNPIFMMLSKFKKVVNSCFSLELAPTFEQDIDSFNSEVAKLIKFTKNELKVELSPTWKIHILVTHLKPFLQEKQIGLGLFCEQTSEAAHCAMKPTIQRFKRKADHRLHGARLLRVAGDFSSKNM